MKIVIDARMYGLEHAGIGRYIINLISQLERLDEKNDFFILLREKYFNNLIFTNKKFKKILADYPHYSFKEQIFLPLQLFKLRPDLVHFPHFNLPIFWWGKYVITIHDLIKHESRGPQTTTKWQLFYWFKYLNYRILIWLAVKRASRIITPSHWWKKELMKRYHLPETKIVVTYEGVDSKFSIFNFQFSKKEKILEKYKIKKPFIVYTGNLYPHKNIERLVKAVKQLNDKNNLSLVIVCSRNVFYQRFEQKLGQMGAENCVNLIGFVPDEELVAIYKEAKAFVFPSLLEGFGLPGLEAMAVGLPVIASNSSCLPEVYSEAAIYFNPYDVKEIAARIEEVLKDEGLKAKLIELGYQQVSKYSWQKTARETLRVYESSFSLRSSQ